MPTPNNGTAVSISHTPQAKDDSFTGTEDRRVTFDVMANDLGGNGKSLYSVDQSNPLHAALSATSKLGAAISIVDGKVVYDSAGASALQALAAGQTATDTFQYVIQLGNGTLSVANVTVTVTGTNDGPVLAADSVVSHALTEVAGATGSAAADTASATLAFTDVDLNDTHSVSIGAPTATWSNGATPAATVTALNGALTSTLADSTGSGAGSVGLAFSAADKAFDFLAKGQTLTVTYNVTITDNNGAASTKPVTFVVTGTNDGPVVAADAGVHALTEAAGATGSATAQTASATLAFTDVDLTDTHQVSIATPAVTWSAGAPPAATLTALNGALTSALHDSTGAGAGSVDLSFSAADKAFDFLAQGETLTVTYDVTVTDNNGEASTKPVTFTITGTNDGPVLSADSVASHALTEAVGATGSAGADTFTTTLAFSDVDLSDHHTASVGLPTIAWSSALPLPGGLATTLIGALSTSVSETAGAGSVTATFAAPDSAFDFLASGQTLTVTYAVTVSDGHGGTATQPVTVVVTGTNDGPVLAADATANHAIAEAAGATGSTAVDGFTTTLAFTDVDLTDHHTLTVGAPSIAWSGGSTLPANLATMLASDLQAGLSEAPGGGVVTATFAAPDGLFDFLAEGETLKVSYDITIDDGHGGTATQTVAFTVTGSNDAPTLLPDTAVHTLNEASFVTNSNAMVSATATLVGHDVDLNDVHTVTAGAGTFVWSGGATLPAGIQAQFANALTLGDGVDSTGTGTGTAIANFSVAQKALDFLGAGETLTATYPITVDDGHGGSATQTVTFTIIGADDAPILGGQAALDHVVNGGFEQGATGWSNSNGHGVEVNPAGTYAVSGASGLVMEVDVDGGLPVDDVYQAVQTVAGQAYSFGFDIAARSGFPGATNGVEVLWNGAVIDTITPGSTAMAHHSYTVFGDGGQDKIEFREINSDGVGGIIDNVTLKDAIAERTGQTGSQSADTSSVTLSLVDVDFNDVHSISRGATSIVWSGGSTLPAGLSTAIDNALTTSIDDTTHKVTGSLTATFSTPDATFDFLAQGETLTITYNLSVNDGHGGIASRPVTFIVTGTNDGPVLAAQGNPVTLGEQVGVTGSASLDTSATLLQFTDADLNDHHTAAVGAPSIAWTGGSTLPAGLSAQLTGALTTSVTDLGTGAGNVVATFSAPDKAFDFMSQGESLTITYNVTLSDGHGGTSVQPVVVTMLGRNDAPVATVTSDGAALTELSGVTGSATTRTSVANLSFTDVDLTDHHTTNISFGSASLSSGVLPGSVVAALQSLAQVTSLVDSSGTGAGSAVVTFSAADSTFDFLAQGQSLSVTYDVAVVDAAGAASVKPVTFVINGANDAPVARVDTVTTAEDTPLTFDPRANDTDPDTGAVLHVTNINGVAIAAGGSVSVSNGGTVKLNADGTLTYNPGLNDNGARSFTYTVADENGATSTSTVNATVTPVNDAPVAVDDLNIQPSLVNNSDFATDLHGWTTNNGPTSSNFIGYTGTASWISSFGGHNGVARLTLNGTVNAPGGSGYGPTIRSDNFSASAGDTVSFDWRLASGSDWALGNGFIKDAATGATVATVFNFNQGQSGDTGWQHTNVVLSGSGNYYMEFQVGSYDSTFGQAVGATMYLDFAGVLPQITEDNVLTINGSQLLANDTDVDSTGLTISSVVGVSDLGATVVLNANGTISYDPRTALNYLNTGQSVVDGFTYTVRDPSGATDTGHVTFTVQGRDEPHLVQYVTNSSFETLGSSSQLPGWTNNGGTALEVVPGSGYGISGAGYVLDSQGTPGGITISQAFDVPTGQAATLTIDLAKELVNGSLHPNSTLTVSFDGQVVLTLHESDFANYNQLKTFTVNVTGQAGLDTLTIHDDGAGNVGYAIDQVRVEAWIL